MTLTSFSFFVFLLIVLLLYYLIKPLQKYILLVASIFFYFSISSTDHLKLLQLVIVVFAITYFGALLIAKARGKIKTIILFFCIFSLVFTVFLLKNAYNVFNLFYFLLKIDRDISWLQFSAVIGISYYAFSAIGYLIDVYWQLYNPVNNPVNVALHIFYFPQLISGPFTRFPLMNNQFNEKHCLKYESVTNGMRRMVLGYFKKLVISERFGLIVKTVYTNYTSYSLIEIVIATLCYAVQLYTDFSGCMDIVLGASQLFDIKLPENFNAPFFSETIQEFWQRWHISLGTWFKDYLMYPLQKSKPIQTIGKIAKSIFGKRVAKKLTFYSAMFVLWTVIGIWHGGTSAYFIASAAIPCILLIISDLCQPLFKWLVTIFRINTECSSWRWFRRIRTILLICICWIFVCSGGTRYAFNTILHMRGDLISYSTFLLALDTFGLSTWDVVLMIIGLIVIYFVQKCEYEGTSIFEIMDKQNFAFRVFMIYAEAFSILFYGMVGSSIFIYFQF